MTMTREEAKLLLIRPIVTSNIISETKAREIEAYNMAIEALSANRQHGEWILECDSEGEGDNLYRCSECGCRYGCQEYDKPNFCLDCGARMKGGAE